MKRMVAFELRRAFVNRGFALSLTAGMVLAVANVVLVAAPYALSDGYAAWRSGAAGQDPPSFFANWMGVTPFSITSVIFYYLLPLLACLPFGSSLYVDLSSGYAHQVVSRAGRVSFFASKSFASFLVAGVVAVAPLVLNIVAVACLLPQIAPDPTTHFYAVLSNTMLADLFYAHPWAYVIVFLALTFFGAGFFGLASIALAFVLRSALAVVLVPFVSCVVLQLATQGTDLAGFAPLNVLVPGQMYPSVFWVVAVIVALSLAVAFAFLMFKGSRYEAL